MVELLLPVGNIELSIRHSAFSIFDGMFDFPFNSMGELYLRIGTNASI